VNTPLVIGLGNDFRRDDGAGRIAARRVRELAGDTVHVVEESGEGAALMDTWRDAESVVLIDAVHSGAKPGTIHRLDATAQRTASAPADRLWDRGDGFHLGRRPVARNCRRRRTNRPNRHCPVRCWRVADKQTTMKNQRDTENEEG